MMDWTGRSRKALYPQPLTTVPISLVVLDEVLVQDSLATRASHGLPGRSPPELAPQSSLRRASMGDPVRSGASDIPIFGTGGDFCVWSGQRDQAAVH